MILFYIWDFCNVVRACLQWDIISTMCGWEMISLTVMLHAHMIKYSQFHKIATYYVYNYCLCSRLSSAKYFIIQISNTPVTLWSRSGLKCFINWWLYNTEGISLLGRLKWERECSHWAPVECQFCLDHPHPNVTFWLVSDVPNHSFGITFINEPTGTLRYLCLLVCSSPSAHSCSHLLICC